MRERGSEGARVWGGCSWTGLPTRLAQMNATTQTHTLSLTTQTHTQSLTEGGAGAARARARRQQEERGARRARS
eukprot:1590348-Rhodomonas_salina.1